MSESRGRRGDCSSCHIQLFAQALDYVADFIIYGNANLSVSGNENAPRGKFPLHFPVHHKEMLI